MKGQLEEIQELQEEVSFLPLSLREKLEPIVERIAESARRRQRIMGLVQDALSQLRLDTKYLFFDLEATRRERDDYRRQLEELKKDT